MSAEPDLDCTSSSVPPLKSMPKFRPWVKNRMIATIESAAEIGKLMRRKRVKSNLRIVRHDPQRRQQIEHGDHGQHGNQDAKPDENELCQSRLSS